MFAHTDCPRLNTISIQVKLRKPRPNNLPGKYHGCDLEMFMVAHDMQISSWGAKVECKLELKSGQLL